MTRHTHRRQPAITVLETVSVLLFVAAFIACAIAFGPV